MFIFSHRKLRFLLAAIAAVGTIVAPAHAAVFVLEDLSYAQSSGLYTYRYALDNRKGLYELNVLSLLVIPVAFPNALPNAAHIDRHTSPPGWSFGVATGGNEEVWGAFAQWSAFPSPGVMPGAYLTGFSISTANPPGNTRAANYLVYSYTTSSIVDSGSVTAPDLTVVGIPSPSIPALSAGGAALLALMLLTTTFTARRMRRDDGTRVD
jgi:hypothetical protein